MRAVIYNTAWQPLTIVELSDTAVALLSSAPWMRLAAKSRSEFPWVDGHAAPVSITRQGVYLHRMDVRIAGKSMASASTPVMLLMLNNDGCEMLEEDMVGALDTFGMLQVWP